MFYSDTFPCQRWIWLNGDSDFNSQNSNSPQARFSATGWNSANNLFLFGGNAGGSQYLNDFWRYDLFSDAWKLLSGNRSDSDYPAPRIGSVGWHWSDQSFVFGGFNRNGFLNNCWMFNESAKQWTKLSGSDGYNETSYTGFLGARSSSVIWKNNDTIFLFGGVGPYISDVGAIQFNDLWCFSDKTWVLIEDNNFRSDNITSPTPRSGAASWNLSDKLFLFGGTNSSSQLLNDLWTFNIATKNWSLVMSDTTLPSYGIRGVSSDTNRPGSRSSTFFWTISDSLLFLFGGYGYDQSISTGVLNDLWVFDTTTQHWIWLFGASDINGSGRYYTPQRQISALNQPSARFGGVSWTVNSDRFLFGGSQIGLSDQLKNDLWKCISLTNCPLEIDIDQQSNVSGFGRSDGSVSIVVSGGSSPYLCLWDSGSTATSLSNLVANDYTVNVSDISGNTAKLTITISQPPPLSVSITIIGSDETEAVCSGGVPPYTYQWDNGDTTTKTQELLAGQHTVIVKDSINDVASNEVIVSGSTYVQSNKIISKTVDISHINLINSWNSSDSICCVGSTYLANFYLSVATNINSAQVSANQNNIIIFESDLYPGFQSISLKAPQNPGNYNLVFTAHDTSSNYSVTHSDMLVVQDKRVHLSDVNITSDEAGWNISGWEIDSISSQRIVKIFNNSTLFFSDQFSSDSCFYESFNSTDFDELGIITVEAYRSDTPYCKSTQKFQYNQGSFALPTLSLSDISLGPVTAGSIFNVPIYVTNSLSENIDLNIIFGNKQYASSGVNGQNNLSFQAPSTPSDYSLSVTANVVDLPDISNTISTIVSVLAAPIVTFYISDKVLSPGQPYTLICAVDIPGGTPSDYVELLISGSDGISVSDVENNTQYVLQRTASFCGNISCTVTDPRTGDFRTQYVPISLQPTVDAGSDQTIALGHTVNLGLGPRLSDVLYTWSPSDGISDMHAFPASARPLSDTTYTVIAQRTNMSNCLASDSVRVTVEPFTLSDVSGSLFIWTGKSFSPSFYINSQASVGIITGWGYSDISDFGQGISQFNIQAPSDLSDTKYTYTVTATSLLNAKQYTYSDTLYVESITLSDFSISPKLVCTSGIFVVSCGATGINTY